MAVGDLLERVTRSHPEPVMTLLGRAHIRIREHERV
jgi:hypothetical protein